MAGSGSAHPASSICECPSPRLDPCSKRKEYCRRHHHTHLRDREESLPRRIVPHPSRRRLTITLPPARPCLNPNFFAYFAAFLRPESKRAKADPALPTARSPSPTLPAQTKRPPSRAAFRLSPLAVSE